MDSNPVLSRFGAQEPRSQITFQKNSSSLNFLIKTLIAKDSCRDNRHLLPSCRILESNYHSDPIYLFGCLYLNTVTKILLKSNLNCHPFEKSILQQDSSVHGICGSSFLSLLFSCSQVVNLLTSFFE